VAFLSFPKSSIKSITRAVAAQKLHAVKGMAGVETKLNPEGVWASNAPRPLKFYLLSRATLL